MFPKTGIRSGELLPPGLMGSFVNQQERLNYLSRDGYRLARVQWWDPRPVVLLPSQPATGRELLNPL